MPTSATATTVAGSLAALPDGEFADAYAGIMATARAAGMEGFSDACWSAAVAINRVIFGGAGRLLAGLNGPLAERAGQHIGHAAVLAREACWDLDGRPKQEDEIEAWGMLDPGDSHYAGIFADHGLRWDADAAADAGLWEEDEAGFIALIGVDAASVESAETALRDAAAAWLAARHALPARP